ncbi:YchE family NAAT transporter [Rheinheimera sp. MMS21-TC3]|uniref:YchE family NAAT transporter n=1 Tax=Rheinheimera sp. MMS21-TC3 TaxID=3072790 RepID=UPI0028C41B8F|nr:YchE family NAAT transporter [Rheinheimera sp. MMS21-TC3]WNO60806.1 YchE family NAAT transporter [Rheinheimera sp. MMS21-TC3]
MLELQDYLKIFIGIFAVMNPLGALPLYLSLTQNDTKHVRRAVAANAAKAATIILLITLFFGELILSFFGISVNSFRVGGGILILLMAISMLYAQTSNAKNTDEEREEAEHRKSVAIVPLAMPMLAGPGAISTTILYANRSDGVLHYAIMSAELCVIGLILWLLMRLAAKIAVRLGQTGMNIITRVMGLILAAIAIEFISAGLKGIFPVLA